MIDMSIRVTAAQLRVIHEMFERPDLLAMLGADLEPLDRRVAAEAVRSLVAARGLSIVDDSTGSGETRLCGPHLLLVDIIMTAAALVVLERDDARVCWFIRGDEMVEVHSVVSDVFDLTLHPVGRQWERLLDTLGWSATEPPIATPPFLVAGPELARLQRAIRRSDRLGIADSLGDGASEHLVDAISGPLAVGSINVLRRSDGLRGEQWSFVDGGDDGWWLIDGDGLVDSDDDEESTTHAVTITRPTEESLRSLIEAALTGD